MQLILIRHSHTVLEKDKSNLLWQLSDKGIEQAELLSQAPEIRNIQVLYSSDQTKALQTALILAKNNYIPIKVKPELTEATSITNGFFDNYDTRVAQWYAMSEHRINEGEVTAEALARFVEAINTIVAAHNDLETIGIVSHANVLSLFTSQFEDRSAFDIHNTITMPDFAILDFDTKKLIKPFTHD